MLVFSAFGVMFLKMSKKHTKRIIGYEDERPFWNFFDKKAYVMMACMMGGGIGLRAAGIFPDIFVAFFYSGCISISRRFICKKLFVLLSVD